LRVRGALIAIKISSCEVSFLEKRQDELVSCHSDVATPVRFTAEWITLSDVPQRLCAIAENRAVQQKKGPLFDHLVGV